MTFFSKKSTNTNTVFLSTNPNDLQMCCFTDGGRIQNPLIQAESYSSSCGTCYKRLRQNRLKRCVAVLFTFLYDCFRKQGQNIVAVSVHTHSENQLLLNMEVWWINTIRMDVAGLMLNGIGSDGTDWYIEDSPQNSRAMTHFLWFCFIFFLFYSNFMSQVL